MTDLRFYLRRQATLQRAPVVRFAPAPKPSFEQLAGYSVGDVWSDAAGWLARVMASDAGAAAGQTVTLPAEASDPAAARAHLVDAFFRLATAHGWPQADVTAALERIKMTPNGPTAEATVRAIRAAARPDPSWPSAVEWYDLADRMASTAAGLAAAQAAGKASVAPAAPAASPPAPKPAPKPPASPSAPRPTSSPSGPAGWSPPDVVEDGGWSWTRIGLFAGGGLLALGAAAAWSSRG